jgi:hypothetical protein
MFAAVLDGSGSAIGPRPGQLRLAARQLEAAEC